MKFRSMLKHTRAGSGLVHRTGNVTGVLLLTLSPVSVSDISLCFFLVAITCLDDHLRNRGDDQSMLLLLVLLLICIGSLSLFWVVLGVVLLLLMEVPLKVLLLFTAIFFVGSL